MKQNLIKSAVCVLLAILTIIFGIFIFRYSVTMPDSSYDLSAMIDDGQEFAEDKGWTVFTQEGANAVKAELSPDGTGGFSGISYPGQTFYFSRIMTENVESPTLKLGAVTCSVVVFLDGEPIYTDVPEQPGGIGTLTLPTYEYDRMDPIIISLPADYPGKTLTIAQSTDPSGGDKQIVDDTVYPCNVTLYCSFAYESSLIAESWQIAVPTSLLFALAVVFLVFFCIGLFRRIKSDGHWWEKVDLGLLSISVSAFFISLAWSSSADYLHQYSYTDIDIFTLCRLFGLCALLLFLADRGKKYKHHCALWIMTGICTAAAVIAAAVLISTPASFSNAQLFFCQTLPQTTGIAALLTTIICAAAFWRRENQFFNIFSIIVISGIGMYIASLLLGLFISPQWSKGELLQFSMIIQNDFAYFLWKLMALSIASAIIASLFTLVRQEIERRTDAAMLDERVKLAQASYETLSAHNDEVMMLRHDITNHLKTLRNMTDEKSISGYLDELLQQNAKIRPIVRSGNEMFDILLNGKLAAAAESGIHTEIIKAEVPQKLPLSDAEMSSVILNILDNALTAASAANTDSPFIRIKAQCKDDFFVFSCENSSTPNAKKNRSVSEQTAAHQSDKSNAAAKTDNKLNKNAEYSPEEMHKHGLGLKIIRQISQRYGNIFTTEQLEDTFKVIFAMPLDNTHSR